MFSQLTNTFFPICSLTISIFLCCMYFLKKNINNEETKLYSKLVICGLSESFLYTFIICSGIFFFNDSTYNIYVFLNKFLCFIYILWMSLLYEYILVVSKKINNDVKKYILNISRIINLVIICLIFIFNVEIMFDSEKMISNATGSSVNILYVSCTLYLFAMIITLILGVDKKRNKKKIIPYYVLFILFAISLIIRTVDPYLNITSNIFSFVLLIMFHTIENPDMKMIEQLNIAKDHAEKANKAKTDFLSSMSHEIRTPLNAIVGFSECIGQADNLTEAKENAHDVIKASQTLLEIVNGILDISKIEAGKIEITNSNYDTKELFESTTRLIKARLGNKNLDFRINIAEDIPDVLYGDKFNLKKVMINLLTNAIKYTDEGFVEFKVHCIKNNDACRLIISVEDSGRGIKTEDMEKLFTKFNRIDEDKNTTIEGTGLGLAITKQLVELMNGKIVVQSVYGKGSRFTVALDQRIGTEVVEVKEVVEQKELNLSGFKVIVVDDNNLNLKVAKKVLEKYNLDISLVNSGLDLLKLIEQGNTYDLILLDDMMPDMRGTEVMHKLKEMQNFNIPTIALTANAITGMKEKYLKDGFDDFLSKPIEKDELYKVLYKYIYSRKQQSNEPQYIEVKQIELIQENIMTDLDLTGKRILVVDDNKLNIKVATNLLTKYNVEMDSSLSGQECIDKINNGETYDLIFMDDMMPEMSGVETFHKLKEKENFNIPVCMLTANAIEGMREKYLKEGFNDYLSKPINKQELIRVLNELL